VEELYGVNTIFPSLSDIFN